MSHIDSMMTAALLWEQLLFPAAAPPTTRDWDPTLTNHRFELPAPALADVAAQQSPPHRPPSPGRRLLRNTLVGAVVGATVVGLFVMRGAGDCGNCESGNAKAILTGAIYGAFIGAAIRVHPSRRPSSKPSQLQTTLRPRVSKHVRSLDVDIHF